MPNGFKECFNTKGRYSAKWVSSKISWEMFMKEENKTAVLDTAGRYSSWGGIFGYKHIDFSKNWHFVSVIRVSECWLRRFWENMYFYFKRYE